MSNDLHKTLESYFIDKAYSVHITKVNGEKILIVTKNTEQYDINREKRRIYDEQYRKEHIEYLRLKDKLVYCKKKVYQLKNKGKLSDVAAREILEHIDVMAKEKTIDEHKINELRTYLEIKPHKSKNCSVEVN